jgi:hypothetical protein
MEKKLLMPIHRILGAVKANNFRVASSPKWQFVIVFMVHLPDPDNELKDLILSCCECRL